MPDETGMLRAPAYLRRSLRRLHFALGAVAMLYILFVSVSGCAIVFEQELYRLLLPDPPIGTSAKLRWVWMRSNL